MKNKIITRIECPISPTETQWRRATREHIRRQKRARAWRSVNAR